MAEKLSIQERFDILDEAIQFFSDLTDAGEENARLWLFKSAALSTVKECLEVYKSKALDDWEWTEETLKEWVELAVDEDYIEVMIKNKGMEKLDADFYIGWFGLAIWILEWDKEQIDGLRELEKQYNNIVGMKNKNKTIADLLK